MKNISFVLWTLLFPIVVQTIHLLRYLRTGEMKPEDLPGLWKILLVLLWIYIAWMLFEG